MILEAREGEVENMEMLTTRTSIWEGEMADLWKSF